MGKIILIIIGALLFLPNPQVPEISGIRRRRGRRLFYLFNGKVIPKAQVSEAKALSTAGRGLLYAVWAETADQARQAIKEGRAERISGLGEASYKLPYSNTIDVATYAPSVQKAIDKALKRNEKHIYIYKTYDGTLKVTKQPVTAQVLADKEYILVSPKKNEISYVKYDRDTQKVSFTKIEPPQHKAKSLPEQTSFTERSQSTLFGGFCGYSEGFTQTEKSLINYFQTSLKDHIRLNPKSNTHEIYNLSSASHYGIDLPKTITRNDLIKLASKIPHALEIGKDFGMPTIIQFNKNILGIQVKGKTPRAEIPEQMTLFGAIEPWQMTLNEFSNVGERDRAKTWGVRMAIRDRGTGKIYPGDEGDRLHLDVLSKIKPIKIKDIEAGFILPDGTYFTKWSKDTMQTPGGFRYIDEGYKADLHRLIVQKARAEGRNVPKEVLSQYSLGGFISHIPSMFIMNRIIKSLRD